jgi:hypothetical protein
MLLGRCIFLNGLTYALRLCRSGIAHHHQTKSPPEEIERPMRLSAFTYSLLSVLLLTLLPELAVTVTAPLTILIPPAAIPPSLLPPSTSASLTTLGVTYTAPLQRDSRFVFRNVSAGSYLLDVHCRDYAFAPLRVDVSDDGKGGLEVDAWQTWRGNEWGNKGERRGGGEVVEVSPVGGKEFYAERQGCESFILSRYPVLRLESCPDQEKLPHHSIPFHSRQTITLTTPYNPRSLSSLPP